MLLDDELPGLTYLKMLCEQIPNLEVVRAFNNPVIFLSEVHNLDFDFCILDIEMPNINGLQVANLLDKKPVIFVTAYKEYAAEAYDLNAIDYVRKPIRKERLKQAVDKVESFLMRSSAFTERSFVQLNTDKGKAVIYFDNIAYIRTSEIDSRDKVTILFNGEEFVLKNITFKSLIKLLPQQDFCQINKGELISIKSINTFTFDEIITNLTSNQGKNIRLSLNEKYRSLFLEKVKIT